MTAPDTPRIPGRRLVPVLVIGVLVCAAVVVAGIVIFDKGADPTPNLPGSDTPAGSDDFEGSRGTGPGRDGDTGDDGDTLPPPVEPAAVPDDLEPPGTVDVRGADAVTVARRLRFLPRTDPDFSSTSRETEQLIARAGQLGAEAAGPLSDHLVEAVPADSVRLLGRALVRAVGADAAPALTRRVRRAEPGRTAGAVEAAELLAGLFEPVGDRRLAPEHAADAADALAALVRAPALVRDASDAGSAALARAVTAVGATGSASGVAALADLLDHESDTVRSRAGRSLGRLGAAGVDAAGRALMDAWDAAGTFEARAALLDGMGACRTAAAADAVAAAARTSNSPAAQLRLVTVLDDQHTRESRAALEDLLGSVTSPEVAGRIRGILEDWDR